MLHGKQKLSTVGLQGDESYRQMVSLAGASLELIGKANPVCFL